MLNFGNNSGSELLKIAPAARIERHNNYNSCSELQWIRLGKLQLTAGAIGRINVSNLAETTNIGRLVGDGAVRLCTLVAAKCNETSEVSWELLSTNPRCSEWIWVHGANDAEIASIAPKFSQHPRLYQGNSRGAKQGRLMVRNSFWYILPWLTQQLSII